MFRTLVVPLDGSPLAERAVPYAIRLAQASSARLVLMQAASNDTLAEAEDYLANVANSMSQQVPAVEVATPRGRPVEMILETIDTYQADGVVMTTHGRTGFGHLLHGSVTEALLARTTVPVLVVCASRGEPEPPALPPDNVRALVPQGYSAYDAPALQAAIELIGPRGEIVLVMAINPPDHVLTDDSGRRVLAYLDQQAEALTRDAREYLSSVAAPLSEGPSAINFQFDVHFGDPVSGIGMAAIETQADLIVMATHGRTGIDRAVFGSVAGGVLRTVHAPVVLVHPTSPPPDDAGLREPVSMEVGPVPTF